jgi:hypothetical protein
MEKLTPKMQAAIPAHVDKWVSIGLSTERADFDAAEEAALACYDLIGCPHPLIVLRMGSPFACVLGGYIAYALLHEAGYSSKNQYEQFITTRIWQQTVARINIQVKRKVNHAIIAQVKEQVAMPVWNQVDYNIGRLVGNKVKEQISDQLVRRVNSSVLKQVEQQVGMQLTKQIDLAKINLLYGLSVYHYHSGQFCSTQSAYASFLVDHGLFKPSPAADKAWILNKTLNATNGFTWWSRDVLSISDRPCFIKRDAEGQLHSDIGHAIEYPDGWGF